MKKKSSCIALVAKDYRTIISRWQGSSYFRRYGQELVSKPAISLKKRWGGGLTVERLAATEKRGETLPSTPADEHTPANKRTQPTYMLCGECSNTSFNRRAWLDSHCCSIRRSKAVVKITRGLADADKFSRTARLSTSGWHRRQQPAAAAEEEVVGGIFN